MTDETVLSDDEAALWFGRFEASIAVECLFEEADVDVAFDEFERTEVSSREGRVTARYYYQESEGNYINLHGVFDEADGDIYFAELDDAYVSAPLAGHGVIWRYQGGEVERSRWIS